ncbi:DUF4839 domain-containing protein [Arthrobacter sp. I2-34]|uniref:DUF4839 domain-containing protein n=1 Tax=Arthrobacter hankyongi TaxID=2904801 RepID=A0ABS9L968_9MICC|nr:DUF4839 domain-containing protein [Arthrobacter hankyongi]MCG2623017.1 DUF4839 domain-containing protein [Arthrobacter hankyongi]
MSGDIKYEYMSVRAVRGMENRAIAKAQKESGWELVDQAQGTLQTTLNFRRVKPETFLSKAWYVFRGLAPAKQRTLAGAAAVLLLLAAGGIGIAAAQNRGETSAESTATESAEAKSTEAVTVDEAPAPSPTPTPSEGTDQVITAKNSKEFAALLKADSCDPSMADFAAKYEGREIKFDGSIVNMQNHAEYKTRYDILLGPGNAGPETAVGPAFRYEDVSMFDLNFTGKNIPSYVGAGDKFRVTAEVGEYSPGQCWFSLTPVSTTAR